MNLGVLSTAKNSRLVTYRVNRNNKFVYVIIGKDIFDGAKIIKEMENKLRNNQKISSKESIYLSLAPIMEKDNDIESNIKRVADILIQLEELTPSAKNLTYGIEWLLVDKYITDKQLRNLLLDKLGDRMSAVYEYGERKELKGLKKGREEGKKLGKKQGIKQGKKLGKKLGKKQGRNSIIQKLYQSGMNPEEIAERVQMSTDSINKIINI